MRLPTRQDGVENRDKVYCSWLDPAGKMGPPFKIFHFFWEFSSRPSGTNHETCSTYRWTENFD